MNSTLTLLCNWKKRTVVAVKTHASMKVPLGCEMITVPIGLDHLITQGKVGFDALHEKLVLLAQMHKFELKPIVELIATSSIIRKIYLTRDCGLPQFVTIQILKLLRESGACVGIGSLRKTESYVIFLRNIVHHERTLPSIASGKPKKYVYVFPEGIETEEFDSIMVGEELRVAEENKAKESSIVRLRKIFHLKQKEEREEVHKQRTVGKGGKKLSEIEQLLADSKAQEVLEAEYDDVPQKKRRK